MWTATRLAIGTLVMFSGGMLLAQPPSNAPLESDNYFPLNPKSKWTYAIQDQTVEMKVSGIEKLNDENCTKVDTLMNGNVVASEYFVGRSDGVYRVQIKNDRIVPPVKLLPIPIVKNFEWEINSQVGSQRVSGKFKIKNDSEKVETPAGKFEAVVIEGKDLDIAGTTTSVTFYLVKGIGIVKLSYSISGAESVMELTKYEAGESPPAAIPEIPPAIAVRQTDNLIQPCHAGYFSPRFLPISNRPPVVYYLDCSGYPNSIQGRCGFRARRGW
jgi:hypothetical protein